MSKKRKRKKKYVEKKEDGYVYISKGVREHKHIFEKAYGRVNGFYWHVHHVNGDKKNNELYNLIALPKHFHAKLHKDYKINELPKRYVLLDLLKKDFESEIDRAKSKIELVNRMKNTDIRLDILNPEVTFIPKTITRKAITEDTNDKRKTSRLNN